MILTATNPDTGPLTWHWVFGALITAGMFFGTIVAAWLLARWQDRVDEAAANRLRVVRDDERTRL